MSIDYLSDVTFTLQLTLIRQKYMNKVKVLIILITANNIALTWWFCWGLNNSKVISKNILRSVRSVIKRPTDSATGTTSGQADTTSGQTSTASGQTSTTNGQTYKRIDRRVLRVEKQVQVLRVTWWVLR